MSAAEIGGVLSRAMLALDEGDRDGFAACFTEDVAITIHFHEGRVLEIRGREDLLRNSKPLHIEDNLLRHLVFTPDISMEGADAATAVYQQLYVWIGDKPGIAGVGRYTDRLRKDGGEWRVAERTHRFLTPVPR
jgi:ketosteroid isomerase-like protein